jgi:hypothetical protein
MSGVSGLGRTSLVFDPGSVTGIGATTAVFSVVYGFLINPYPYKDSDRMVTGADLPEDVQADYFSSNTFEYFGVPPALACISHRPTSECVEGT